MTKLERAIKALQGCQVGTYSLTVGRYSNGRIGIEAWDDNGECECKVTVNIVDEPLEEGEFLVRRDAMRFSPAVFQGIRDCGIAKPTGRVVPAGRVEQYAEVWRLELDGLWCRDLTGGGDV